MTRKQGTVSIDHSRCKLCGICANMCPVNNYTIIRHRLKELGKCIACMQCERYCPDMALVIDTKR
ncbi:MAG: 4Fe-4S dicluster domain-containing protein [Planctomycetes bacterium]|nr:4Fe-4S dicluster domain-containing protein [Planctomycetota bacterium]